MRVSQAEQTAEQAFEETGNLLDQIADLRDKVAQVKPPPPPPPGVIVTITGSRF
jgi:hypothetical protein